MQASSLDEARRRRAIVRQVAVETLESRRLFSVVLTFSAGVLTYTETQNNVNTFTTLQHLGNGMLQISEGGSDTLSLAPELVNAGWTLSGNTASGPETGISSVVVDGDNGGETVNIPSNDVPIFIEPRGAVSVQLTVGGSPTGAQANVADIRLDGTNAKFASLIIDDAADPNNVDPTITSTSVLNLAGAPVDYVAPPLQSNGNPALLIDCEAGHSTSGFIINQAPPVTHPVTFQFDTLGTGTLGIEQLAANSSVLVNPQRGASEAVHLGSLGLIAGALGSIDVSGQGTSSITVDDSKDTASHTFTLTNTSIGGTLNQDGRQVVTMIDPISAFTLMTGTASNIVNLDPGGFRQSSFVFTLASGGTNDTVNVLGLAATGALDLQGGAGVDAINLTAGGILGTVNVTNANGQDAVTLDGSGLSQSQLVSVTDSRITGLGQGTYNLANLRSLSIVGGSAFDNFTVVPSATIPIVVDGGAATGVPQDRLQVTTTGVTGTALSLQNNAGSLSGGYTFTNRHPLNFTRLGTINPTFGDVSGTVFNAQSAAAVAGTTVVVDENSNGKADPGEPSATTDSNGKFALTGLPTGTFPLLVQATGFALQTGVSAVVSAGVLPTPLLVPILPTTTAGAADLVASVVATASGITGSIRPKVTVKVTNLGAAMSSAIPLQILLAASTDTSLDPNDPQLLKAFTAPVALKSKQSRNFTFTGATAAGLTRGNYFVLASVDASNLVAESNESNNVAASARQVMLAPPVVDLTGKFARLPRTAKASKILNVGFTLQNLGTVPAAGTIDFDFFASTDLTLSDNDPSLGSHLPITAHVAAGKSQSLTFKLSLSALPAGTYYLAARVNSTSTIAEQTLSNNLIFSATPVVVS